MTVYTVHPDDVIRSKMDGKGRITVPKDVREQWRVSSGDHVEFAVVDVEGRGYECDECGGRFDLPEVFYDEETGRVVCAGCAGVEERITTDGGADPEDDVDEQEDEGPDLLEGAVDAIDEDLSDEQLEAVEALLEESIEDVDGSRRLRDKFDSLTGDVDESEVSLTVSPYSDGEIVVDAVVGGTVYGIGTVTEVDPA